MAKRHNIKLSTSIQTKDGRAGDIRYNPWGSPELALQGITGIQRVEGATPVPVRVGAVFALYWFVGGTQDQHFVPYNPQIGQPDALIYAGFSFNTDKTQYTLNGTKWRISDIPFTLQTPVTRDIPEADAGGLFRADIVHVDYNGQEHYTVGTAGATAVAPDLPYKHILVTTIYVDLTETTSVEPPLEYPDVRLRQGAGDPSNTIGIAGDSYLNTVNGEIWFKTLLVDEVATWELKYTPSSGGTSLPDGGTTGQVLAKVSNDNGDAEWVEPLAGEQGEQGEQGIQGIQGIQGVQGVAGTNGTNGTNGQGVPTGGTALQVLRKIDGTDFNTEWATPSAGGLPTQIFNVTLSEAGWGLASGFYEYTYTNALITVKSIVDATPQNASIAVVRSARMLPLVTSFVGSCKFFSNNAPSDDIIVNIVITESA